MIEACHPKANIGARCIFMSGRGVREFVATQGKILPACTNRFVFVAGLHRTGTSLIARILSAHPNVSGIAGSQMPEDEGCYLQGAIPHTALHGKPGHFATDPAQHFTERSGWNTLETKHRLLEDWSPWFDQAKPWWLEKSPVNLTRMRLYQQLFPRSQFIVILRHPQVMAAALAKWVNDEPAALVRYALDAYDLVETDLAYLHSALVLRYEDLVAEPVAMRKAALAFLGLGDHDPAIEIIDRNEAYPVRDNLAPDVEKRMAKWGYGAGGAVTPFAAICRHPLRDIREIVADVVPS